MRHCAVFILFTGLLVAVAGAACTNNEADEAGSTLDVFQSEVDQGASCARLYELRNELDPTDPNIELMNDELRRIGCSSSSSERTDSDRPAGTEGLEPISYNSAYAVCSHDREETYRQSGTNDPEEAARWLAESSVPGVARQSSYQGCLDGLLGMPNKFGE